MPTSASYGSPVELLYSPWRSRFTPPWLGKPADQWNASLGALQDRQVYRAKQAVKARFPSLAPVDALPLIGQDRVIERGPAETDAQYAARLSAAHDAWRYAGTRKGLTDYVLTPAGYTNTRIITNREWGTTYDGHVLGGVPPDGRADLWARFWLVVGTPPVYTRRTWDSGWDYDVPPTMTWDSDATADDVATLKRLILTWKSARDVALGAIMVFGATTLPDAVPGVAPWRPDSLTFGGAPCMFWQF